MPRATLSLVLLCAAIAQAQELRGVVVDSASRSPVSGAVVMSLDSNQTVLSRTLTSDLGEYRLSRPAALRALRVIRMGFRPRDVAVPQMTTVVERFDVAMLVLPTLMEKVSVEAAAGCPRRSDSQAAYALMEQARAGLLATIVSRESNRSALKLLTFTRTLQDLQGRALRQTVTIDSGGGRAGSYGAVRSAVGFIQEGFARDTAGDLVFYGPDAETLLDDDFANGYCFGVHERDRARPSQIGLTFSMPRRRPGRVDIDGTLWIDTAARIVRDIEFKYVGLPQGVERFGPGGYISFRQMPNGMVLVDRWLFRLLDFGADTSMSAGGVETVRYYPFAREVGGEVASAVFPDGRVWAADLGTARIHVADKNGKPIRNIILRFDETDYVASPDENGNAVFRDLVPGPYRVMVVDSALAKLGITLGTELRFTADRNRFVTANLTPPTPDEFLKRACVTGDNQRWVATRLVGASGRAVTNVQWEIGEGLGSTTEFVRARGTTGSKGEFGFCHDSDAPGVWRIRVTVAGPDGSTTTWDIPANVNSKIALRIPNLPVRVADRE